MKIIGISQRVEFINNYNETRDCLDQRWTLLAHELNCLVYPIPNLFNKHPSSYLDNLSLDAIILSGGGSVEHFSWDAEMSPRDHTEALLIAEGRKRKIPVLGICRGMQFINLYFGGRISRVNNHVACYHHLNVLSEYQDLINNSVNSYHNFGIMRKELAHCLMPIAWDDADCIEGFIHHDERIAGIMWHPERESGFNSKDIDLLRKFLL